MMADETRKATLAGILIIVSVLTAATIIIITASTDRLLRVHKQYTVVFSAGSDVQGLDDKSGVRMLGVDVGRVEKVRIEADELGTPRVLVSFSMPAEHVLRQGAKVTVQSNITGGARLNIESLGSGDALAAGELIDGYTLTIGDVMAQLHGLMPTASSGIESFTQTSADISALVRDVHGKVDQVVVRYEAVMNTAESALANARDILGDSKTDLRDTIANVRKLTSTAAEKMPDALDEARALMTRARESMARLDPILDDGKAISAQVRSTINDNRANIDQTMINLRRTSVELKGGVSEIRRAPWRLLKEPDARDQRNLELYEVARRFADGAHDLQAAAMSIQLAAADPNTDVQRLDEMREELARQIATFVEVRQKLWDRFEH